MLCTASAKIGYMYKGLQLCNILECLESQLLITGLIKSGTNVLMKRSKVTPVQSFHDLFRSWPEDTHLTLKKLEVKGHYSLGRNVNA